MSNDKRSEYLTRNGILKQLSDVEVTHVSTAETAEHLTDGDEYLDLEQLDHGVQKACGAINRTMGRVLPRKAVHAATWQKLISLLATPCAAAAHVGEHKPCCLHLLPPHAQEGLKLTCDQQKQVADLEVETKAKLHNILTPEQLQQLKQMRPPTPQGVPGCAAHGGHAPAKVCPSKAPKTRVPTVSKAEQH